MAHVAIGWYHHPTPVANAHTHRDIAKGKGNERKYTRIRKESAQRQQGFRQPTSGQSSPPRGIHTQRRPSLFLEGLEFGLYYTYITMDPVDHQILS